MVVSLLSCIDYSDSAIKLWCISNQEKKHVDNNKKATILIYQTRITLNQTKSQAKGKT